MKYIVARVRFERLSSIVYVLNLIDMGSGGSRNEPGGAKEQGEQKILLGRHSILVDIT